MKKIIWMFLASLIFNYFTLQSLQADVEKSSLYYVKLGGFYTVKSYYGLSFGGGARFQKGHKGVDLSATFSSAIFENSASLKGMFLFYPTLHKSHPFYLGLGSGVWYHESTALMGQPYGSSTNEHGILSLDGVLGMEFRKTHRIKTFVQLELSQPVFNFGNRNNSSSYHPSLSLMGGVGI